MQTVLEKVMSKTQLSETDSFKPSRKIPDAAFFMPNEAEFDPARISSSGRALGDVRHAQMMVATENRTKAELLAAISPGVLARFEAAFEDAARLRSEAWESFHETYAAANTLREKIVGLADGQSQVRRLQSEQAELNRRLDDPATVARMPEAEITGLIAKRDAMPGAIEVAKQSLPRVEDMRDLAALREIDLEALLKAMRQEVAQGRDPHLAGLLAQVTL